VKNRLEMEKSYY